MQAQRVGPELLVAKCVVAEDLLAVELRLSGQGRRERGKPHCGRNDCKSFHTYLPSPRVQTLPATHVPGRTLLMSKGGAGVGKVWCGGLAVTQPDRRPT